MMMVFVVPATAGSLSAYEYTTGNYYGFGSGVILYRI
jgi:hypothetical protein